jgi:hypothetical protein
VVISVSAAAFIVGEIGGYSLHGHRMAESVIAGQQQMAAELEQIRIQIADLSSKVNSPSIRSEAQPVMPLPGGVETPATHSAVPNRRPSENLQLKKMQSQLDQQAKAIDQQSRAIDQEGKALADTQSQLESTRRDLSNTQRELAGSIARTHEELLLLQRRGARNYYEFDIAKSKQFQHDGPIGVRLRKADTKHQYADLDLIVEDRTVSQKHVNLYQQVMFHTADSEQPAELVINDISKDHIHGYVSSPKHRQSELASVPVPNQTDQSKSGEQPAQRQAVTPPR